MDKVLVAGAVIVLLGELSQLRGRSRARTLMSLAIYFSVILLVGIIWVISAIMASSPQAPAWVQHAPPVVGALSGVIFVILFFWTLRFRKRS